MCNFFRMNFKHLHFCDVLALKLKMILNSISFYLLIYFVRYIYQIILFLCLHRLWGACTSSTRHWKTSISMILMVKLSSLCMMFALIFIILLSFSCWRIHNAFFPWKNEMISDLNLNHSPCILYCFGNGS